MSETITLTRTDEEGTETMTVTRDGGEVRTVYTVDSSTVDDRVAFSGQDGEAESWLRARLIDWQADGYREV